MSKETSSHPVKGSARHDIYSDSSPPPPPKSNIPINYKGEKETDSHGQQDQEKRQIDASGVDREGLAHGAMFRDFLHFVVLSTMFWVSIGLQF